MSTRLSVSGITFALAGGVLLALGACRVAPTAPEEFGEVDMSVEVASSGAVHSVAPRLARASGGKEMVPLRIREWIEAADDAAELECEGEGGLKVGRNHWTGSALVSHLGRSAVDLRIVSCTTELVQVGEDLHLWTADYTASYAAANGDELWVAGVLRSYVPERIEVDFTITGGTGRFAGATGSATGDGAREPDAYVAYAEAHGVMSRPNSSR